MTDVERDTRAAYEDAAAAWASGPDVVYRQLAAALLDRCPIALDRAQVLDIGAGTGVLGDEARSRGGRCVEVDVAIAMLAHGAGRRGIAADGRALPFRDSSFDVVAGNCSLSHVANPDHMLAEAVRVTRAGGVVVFSAFPGDSRSHHAWDAVETVLREHGYERPRWYAQLKAIIEPVVGTAAALIDRATAAGARRVTVSRVRVETGLQDPGLLADWRLGMAQHAAFLKTRPTDHRAAIRTAAIARIGPDPAPLHVDLLVLTGRA